MIYKLICKVKISMERKMDLKLYRKSKIKIMKRMTELEERINKIMYSNADYLAKREAKFLLKTLKVNKQMLDILEILIDENSRK